MGFCLPFTDAQGKGTNLDANPRLSSGGQILTYRLLAVILGKLVILSRSHFVLVKLG